MSFEALGKDVIGLIMLQIGVDASINLAATWKNLRHRVITNSERWNQLIRKRWPDATGGDYTYALKRWQSEKRLLAGEVKVSTIRSRNLSHFHPGTIFYLNGDPHYVWEGPHTLSAWNVKTKKLLFEHVGKCGRGHCVIQIEKTPHLVYANRLPHHRLICRNLATDEETLSLLREPYSVHTFLAGERKGEPCVVVLLNTGVDIWWPSVGKHYHMRHRCPNPFGQPLFPCAKIVSTETGPELIVADGKSVYVFPLFSDEKPKHRLVLKGHAEMVTCFQELVRPDALQLVTGSLDHSVCVWDLETGNCLETFNFRNAVKRLLLIPREDLAPFLCVTSLSLLPKGRKEIQSFAVWDLATGKLRAAHNSYPCRGWQQVVLAGKSYQVWGREESDLTILDWSQKKPVMTTHQLSTIFLNRKWGELAAVLDIQLVELNGRTALVVRDGEKEGSLLLIQAKPLGVKATIRSWLS